MVKFYNPILESKDEIIAIKDAVNNTINSGQFILGKSLENFEINYSKYIGSQFCSGVGNGLDALRIILRSYNIGPGDEVIVPAHTFIATWLPINDLGAKAIPVDIDLSTYNIDLNQISKYISKNTKAIIPVHLYGLPCDIFELKSLIPKSIKIIEDAAQAHGAELNGIKCGNLGDAAAFSFYPTKNLGALGDGGAITTSCHETNSKIQLLRNYGSCQKYVHEVPGSNSRLDEIQSAVLSIKLKLLDNKIIKRREIAKVYCENISNDKLTLPFNASNHVWHQFVLRTKDRSKFIKHLDKNNIQTLIHYPIPPHKSKIYKNEFASNQFPVTNKVCDEVVSLPIYPNMPIEDISKVIDICNQY